MNAVYEGQQSSYILSFSPRFPLHFSRFVVSTLFSSECKLSLSLSLSPPLSHIHTIPQIITAFAVQEPLMYLILCTRGGLFRNPTHSDPPPPPMARFVRLWKIPNRVEVPWLSTTSGGRHRLSFLLTSCSACRLLISPSLPPPALSYQQVLSALNTIRWNVSLCPSLAGFN